MMFAGLSIVSAAHRGMPPLGYCIMASNAYVGAALYEVLCGL